MTKSSSSRFSPIRIALWLLLGLVLVGAVGLWLNRAAVSGYGETASAYSARVACSCRFVAGRDLDDCTKDKLGGMELVSLSDDVDAKSVTASFPMVTSVTATYREGYGCVLEPYEG